AARPGTPACRHAGCGVTCPLVWPGARTCTRASRGTPASSLTFEGSTHEKAALHRTVRCRAVRPRPGPGGGVWELQGERRRQDLPQHPDAARHTAVGPVVSVFPRRGPQPARRPCRLLPELAGTAAARRCRHPARAAAHAAGPASTHPANRLLHNRFAAAPGAVVLVRPLIRRGGWRV